MKINPINVTIILLCLFISASSFSQEKIIATRLESNPIIIPELLKGDNGNNINGPSLIKVPNWLENKLGKYYLYFGHHAGKYIRLAYANDLKGPWKVYEKGTLKLDDCICKNHLASPDFLIDSINQKIAMYFHCPVNIIADDGSKTSPQLTIRATSKNGIDFISENQPLGDSYFRLFKWNDDFYTIARTGKLYKSKDGISNFEEGPNPLKTVNEGYEVRHVAVLQKNNLLYVFYSRIGDMPERIMASTILLNIDWKNWTASPPITILESETNDEGVNEPLAKSESGKSIGKLHELRDPCIFEENGKVYLLYSIAGENGISIAELHFGK
jgi:hypothetical protein